MVIYRNIFMYLFWAAISIASLISAPMYQLVDINHPSGVGNSYLLDINNHGEVIGTHYLPAPSGFGSISQHFYWKDGQFSYLHDDLPPELPPHSNPTQINPIEIQRSINDHGAVLGSIHHIERKEVYWQEGESIEYGSYPSASHLGFGEINNQFQAAGIAQFGGINVFPYNPNKIYFAENGVIEILAEDDGLNYAFGGLNDQGRLAGTVRDEEERQQGFYWEDDSFAFLESLYIDG